MMYGKEVLQNHIQQVRARIRARLEEIEYLHRLITVFGIDHPSPELNFAWTRTARGNISHRIHEIASYKIKDVKSTILGVQSDTPFVEWTVRYHGLVGGEVMIICKNKPIEFFHLVNMVDPTCHFPTIPNLAPSIHEAREKVANWIIYRTSSSHEEAALVRALVEVFVHDTVQLFPIFQALPMDEPGLKQRECIEELFLNKG